MIELLPLTERAFIVSLHINTMYTKTASSAAFFIITINFDSDL